MLLAVQLASSYPATAQTPSCTSQAPYANPLTLAGKYSDSVGCEDLTEGLRLNLNGAQIGESNDLVDIALNIDAEGAGDKDVVVAGQATMYSALHGVQMERDGAGVLRLDLTQGKVVMSGASAATEGVGIRLVHKGKAGGTAEAPTMTKGIHLVSGADIDMSKLTISDKKGIIVHAGDSQATSPIHSVIPITIALTGGTIHADSGLSVEQFARGDIDVTIGPAAKLGTEGARIATQGLGVILKDKSVGNITILHQGQIHAGEGIEARNLATSATEGDVTVTTAAGSVIVAEDDNEDSIFAEISEATSTGDIRVIHNGAIDAKRIGIFTYNVGKGNVTVETGMSSTIVARDATHGSGINASVRKTSGDDDGDVRVTHRGTINAKTSGIYAANRGRNTDADGTIRVTTTERSTITAGNQGILVWHQGTGQSYVTIGGTVTGGTDHAGVHVQVKTTDTRTGAGGGSAIVIGPRAHVSSARSEDKVAIQVDANAGTTTITLDKDEAGVVGHVEGQILNPAREGESPLPRSKLVFKTRSVSGSETVLDAPGAIIYRRGDRTGVYEQVFKAELKELDDDKGYWFKDVASAPVLRLYSHRARLYEVLPSVLLGLVDLTPYSTRMAVPRRIAGNEEVMVQSSKGEHVATPGSRTGVWVRLAVRDGERMANTSTTATDFWRQSLAWDVKQTDFEAGLEVPTDERLVLGVSAHYRQSEATVKRGGTMEASGTGLGVSVTWTNDSGLYVDGQLSYTRFFDITMVSANGAVGAITSTGGGSGLALGVEVGQPMSMGGLTVIPRGGLSWSSVDLDAFDEPARIDGAGRVAPDKEQSVQGRVGVLAELAPKEADGRLYASLDLEHEFSSKHEAMVAGTRLATEVKPTWVRLGVGGTMSLGGHDTTRLTGDAFYATAGSDNTDFGGGLSVTFRF